MQKITRDVLIDKAAKLLDGRVVDIVLGWRKGLFDYDVTPSSFATEEDLRENFRFDDHCGANFSKYLIAQTKKTKS